MRSEDRFGFRDFGNALACMAVGTVTAPVAVLPRVVRRLPSAVKAVFRRIRIEPTVGPNIKNIATGVLPLGIVVAVPLVAVGSVLGGMAGGTYFSFKDKNALAVVKEINKMACDVDQQFIEDVLPGISRIKPDALPEGQKPYDISPLRALGAFGTGLTLSVVEGPGLTGVYLLHAPRLWWKATRHMWSETTVPMALLTVLMQIGITKGAVLFAPLSLLGGTLFGLGAGAKRGYTDGFTAAWAKSLEDLREVHTQLNKMHDRIGD